VPDHLAAIEQCTPANTPPVWTYAAHGGGKRCQREGCAKGAASGGTPHCMAHGGDKRCREEDCFELVARASQYCRRCPQ